MKEKFLELIKKKNFIIACCVLVLTVITMKVSFSYIFTIKTNNNNQTIQEGLLEITYGKEGNLIAKMNVHSMSDEEGLKQNEVGIINIHNNGKDYANYDITVDNDYKSFQNRAGYESDDYLVPLKDLKIAIYKYAENKSTLITGPILISELPKSNINGRHILLSGSLGPISNTNITYQIKVWKNDSSIQEETKNFIFLKSEVNNK